MNSWFRFYNEALNDPKVQRLPGDQFKVWVNFMCLASKGDGLVMRKDVTFALRFTDEKEADFFLGKLIEANLIEDRGDVLIPHNWRKRQYKSDVSTARVKQFRKRQRNVSETPPEQSRTDTEQNRTDNQAVADATRPGNGFEDFWKSYPKRDGANPRSTAESAYVKALKAGAMPADLLVAVRKFATSPKTKVGTEFVPQAATWLNQKRWEAWLGTGPPSPPGGDDIHPVEIYGNLQ